jgi:hypothetical protein
MSRRRGDVACLVVTGGIGDQQQAFGETGSSVA